MDYGRNYQIDQDMPIVLFKLNGVQYGMRSDRIQSFTQFEAVHALPDAPGFVRGVINLRGQIMPLVDLRVALGMKAAPVELDETKELLEGRKQDHLNWLNKLEESVRTNSEFSLTTDPHACAFGKWYDNYKPRSEMLRHHLKKMDEPHKAIHAIADRVKAHQREGNFEMAWKLVAQTREQELSQMVELFDQLCDALHHNMREIAIVMETGSGSLMAAVVDEIIGIEQVVDTDTNSVVAANYRIAKRAKDSSPVILLDGAWVAGLGREIDPPAVLER